MFITIQPEVYEDIFYHENIMAAHKIVTHLTLIRRLQSDSTYVESTLLSKLVQQSVLGGLDQRGLVKFDILFSYVFLTYKAAK